MNNDGFKRFIRKIEGKDEPKKEQRLYGTNVSLSELVTIDILFDTDEYAVGNLEC